MPLAGQLAALQARVRELEGSTPGERREPLASPAAAAATEAAAWQELGLGVEELAARVAEVEAKLARLEGAPRPAIVLGGAPAESAEERRRVVEASQSAALDRAAAAADRLEALKQLRGRSGRSPEVVRAMIELIQDPRTEARTRADIIRNLSGVDLPELKQPLLAVLQGDSHSETRSETVETLEVFYDDPAVQAAVAHLRDHDPDPDVRREARRRLLQHEARQGRARD